MRSLKQNETGLTIVEIIVALFVGAILVGSINVIYTNQVFIAQSARARALTNAFAEGKVESLRSAGYLTLTDGTTNITSELPSDLNDPKSATMVISTPTTGVKRVKLTINYFSQGKQRTETYTTNIGELGAGQQ